MKKENTAASTFPAVIVGANRHSIRHKADALVSFLAPLQQLSCDDIHAIKNLEAAMEFMEDDTYDAWIESCRILDKLQEYDGEYYRSMVTGSNLPLAKQMLLINLHILYENANRLGFRCGVVTYDNETLNVLAKDVRPWIDEVLYTIKHMLQVIATEDAGNIMDKEQYEALNQKVRKLNGEVISFYEMRM